MQGRPSWGLVHPIHTRQHPLARLYQELFCQLFHTDQLRLVSYSRQGAWQCTKLACRAQANHAEASPSPSTNPLDRRAGRRRASTWQIRIDRRTTWPYRKG